VALQHPTFFHVDHADKLDCLFPVRKVAVRSYISEEPNEETTYSPEIASMEPEGLRAKCVTAVVGRTS
jgi:hypothetical protein